MPVSANYQRKFETIFREMLPMREYNMLIACMSDKKVCAYGRVHVTTVDEVIVGHGVINQILWLPERIVNNRMQINVKKRAAKLKCTLLVLLSCSNQKLILRRFQDSYRSRRNADWCHV